MFLFRWCMHAINCRRDMTVETMPLSPTKHNGMVGSPVDCVVGLQRHLTPHDLTGIRRALLDEGDSVDPPSFFEERHNSIPHHMAGVCSAGENNLCDVKEGPIFSSQFLASISPDQITAIGLNGNCACQNDTPDATVDENTGPATFSYPVTYNGNFTSTIAHCEKQRLTKSGKEAECLDRSDALVVNDEHANSSGDGRSVLNASDYTPVTTCPNPPDSLPYDGSHRLLINTASLLVEYSIGAAVRIVNDSVAVSPISEPVHTAANNMDEESPTSEDLSDSAESAARQLIDQMLHEIVSRNGSSVFTRAPLCRDETPTCPVYCSFPVSLESRSEALPENATKSGSISTVGVILPTADELPPTSTSTSTCSVEQPVGLLAAYGYVSRSHASDCELTDLIQEDELEESMSSSLSAGRLTFTSEIPPPSIDSNSPDDATDVLNNNRLGAEWLADACNGRCIGDGYGRQTLDAESTADQKINHNITSPKISNFREFDNADDSGDLQPTRASEETWNYCEADCRTEEYFFRRYVIPVDWLADSKTCVESSDEATSGLMEDNDDQLPGKMLSDLETAQEVGVANVDAEVEAMAAFCRAMFTPIPAELDKAFSPPSTLDMCSSPETPDVAVPTGGRPPAVRRCISLRTSPGVPHEKKSVRFADALGLDLEYVRQIQNVDDSTTFGDVDEDRPHRPLLAEASSTWRRTWPLARRYLCACFQAPGSHPDFTERVKLSRVVLESYEINNRSLTIIGVVRVANVAYHKTVVARVTTDGWSTQTDVGAEYVPRSNDGTTDRFAFEVVLPRGATEVGRRVELAICFTAFFDCHAESYWDNNFGANYCFECYNSNSNDDD